MSYYECNDEIYYTDIIGICMHQPEQLNKIQKIRKLPV